MNSIAPFWSYSSSLLHFSFLFFFFSAYLLLLLLLFFFVCLFSSSPFHFVFSPSLLVYSLLIFNLSYVSLMYILCPMRLFFFFFFFIIFLCHSPVCFFIILLFLFSFFCSSLLSFPFLFSLIVFGTFTRNHKHRPQVSQVSAGKACRERMGMGNNQCKKKMKIHLAMTEMMIIFGKKNEDEHEKKWKKIFWPCPARGCKIFIRIDHQ